MELQGLQKLSYGMYVVSSIKGESINACLVNTVFQITAEPAMIAVSMSKENWTHDFIVESKIFALSILTQDADMKFIGNFGFRTGKDFDKFANVRYKILETGAPVTVDNTCAYIEANVVDSIDVKTHTIFIGKVENTSIVSDSRPMTYSYYHEVIKGKTAKKAPTYIG